MRSSVMKNIAKLGLVAGLAFSPALMMTAEAAQAQVRAPVVENHYPMRNFCQWRYDWREHRWERVCQWCYWRYDWRWHRWIRVCYPIYRY
jgi:hypothetical protein